MSRNKRQVQDTLGSSVGRFVLFPRDLDAWLVKHAGRRDYRSSAELVRQIVRAYRQKIEAAERRQEQAVEREAAQKIRRETQAV